MVIHRLTVTILCTLALAPPADAVAPPPVDPTLLPAVSPPRPPYSTEQYGPCVTAADQRVRAVPVRHDLEAAWAVTRGAGQTVAVIDTGVSRHRLLPNLVAGGDYVSTGDGTDDCDGHGTIVAGIIGAAPGDPSGFSGIAPAAAILAIRQSSSRFRPTAGGDGVGDVGTLAAAVRLAADRGATVINISSVACLEAAAPIDDGALGAALRYAVDTKNAVVVAAAGNVGGRGSCPAQNAQPDWAHVNVIASPCWYDELVLTVGSVDADGAASDFTLAGPWVDVAAPGESVVSLSTSGEGLVDKTPDSTEPQPLSGTSYAAPVVSGYVALLRASAPYLTARQVMRRVEDTALRPASGWDPLTGNGVADAIGALDGISSDLAVAPTAVQQLPEAERGVARPSRVALVGAGVCTLVAIGLIATKRSGRSVPHR